MDTVGCFNNLYSIIFVNIILHHWHLWWFINHRAINSSNKCYPHSLHIYWPFLFADARILPYVSAASVIHVSLSFISNIIFCKSISFLLEDGPAKWVARVCSSFAERLDAWHSFHFLHALRTFPGDSLWTFNRLCQSFILSALWSLWADLVVLF